MCVSSFAQLDQRRPSRLATLSRFLHHSMQLLPGSHGLVALSMLISLVLPPCPSLADEVAFERIQLTSDFYSEGGTFADWNGDGHGDVAVGPWIYWGPSFESKSRFYEGEAFDPAGYSKNFLMYSGDVNDDGHSDIYVLGFPGEESWWYENPGPAAAAGQLWQRHTMIQVTDNESPVMKDIDGDGIADLVCSSNGHYGYATRAGQSPYELWRFVKISPNNNYHRFTHGLGVGDVNNDGHQDLIEKDGWWQNPGRLLEEGQYWRFHPFRFSEGGGSQMHAVDLDGDGRNEIVTGLAAHGYGLVYYRATNADATQFERVDIMTDDPATSSLGVAVSQLHALEIIDVNNDQIPDIVTGKRWWAHANGDPGSSEPATLMWIETKRVAGGVRFVPHLIDHSSGVGTQVSVGDINGDGTVDILAGTKRGTHLFLQRPKGHVSSVPLVAAQAAKDDFAQRLADGILKLDDTLGGFVPAVDGRGLNFNFQSDQLVDWEVRGGIREGFRNHDSFDSGSTQPDKIGELISRPFRLAHPFLSFEVAGSGHAEARVELISEESGQALLTASGSGDAELNRQVFDISPWQGHVVRLRLVDHARDGYVRFTDVRLHASRP
jgi:hypothetical protein